MLPVSECLFCLLVDEKANITYLMALLSMGRRLGMGELFSQEVAQLADAMGVALYQRFSIQEASLFLRCSIDAVEKLIKKEKVGYIHIAGGEVSFLGYQLVEHILGSIQSVQSLQSPPPADPNGDRIITMKEVVAMTALSRTTVWRLEQRQEFPARVSLCAGRVGWRLSEVSAWIRDR